MIKRKKSIKNTFNVSFYPVKIIPLTVLVSLALTWGMAQPLTELIPMPELVKEMMMRIQQARGCSMFIFMVIVAPIGEEFIFRGIILDGLLNRYSAWKAIMFSALLFGIAHLNPWQFVPAFILGIFFGWIYYNTQKNVLHTIILHSIVNLSGFITHFFPEQFINATSYADILGGQFNYIMFIIACIVLTCFSIWLLYKGFCVQEKSIYKKYAE
jgi:membrane protease YdiL (CAAX protease family)